MNLRHLSLSHYRLRKWDGAAYFVQLVVRWINSEVGTQNYP